jgi:threonine/homoserine/homoserine lactone efflux protein
MVPNIFFLQTSPMLETLSILLITQLFAMMSPGPDMFLILKNSMIHKNATVAYCTILGIGLGLTFHISISIAGLGIFLTQSESLFRIIRFAGAGYLGYLGFKSLFNSSKFQSVIAEDKELNLIAAFKEGLFTNLLNPKVTLFIISLFTQVIRPSASYYEKSTYGLVLVAEAIVVWTIFSRAVRLETVRQALENHTLWLDRLFGLILLGIAGSVFWMG